MIVECPTCKKRHDLDADWIGKRVMCRACGTASTVSGGMRSPGSAVTPPPQNPVSPAAFAPVASSPGFGKGDTLVPAMFLGYAAVLTLFLGVQTVYVAERDPFYHFLGFCLSGLLMPVVLGMLVNLGVFVASKMTGFPRRPRLRWRCLAVGWTLLLAPLATRVFDIGKMWSAILEVTAVAAAVGLLWFVLRLNNRRFALAAVFGIGFPVAAWVGIGAVFQFQQHLKEAERSAQLESQMRTEIRDIRTTHESVPLPVLSTNPVVLLTSLAHAEQRFHDTHGGIYATTETDLISAGFARGMFVDPDTARRLRFRNDLPRIAALPADFIVASVLDADESGYTVLFGNWNIGHVGVSDWAGTDVKSNAALRNALRSQ